DLRDALADELRDVDVDLGRDLAGHDDEAGGDQRLAGHAAVRVAAQHRVEDAVRHLVGNLVRMAFGDRLGREEELSRAHGRADYRPRYLIRRKKVIWSSCVCDAAYSTA